eukprot:569607_1
MIPSITLHSIVSALILIFFALSFIYDIHKQRNAKNASRAQTNIVALTYANLFVITACIISGTIVLLFPTSDVMCNWITRIWFLLFHLHRCLLYLISVQRMTIMYSDTIIPFNINTHRYIVYVLILIYACIYLIIPLALSFVSSIDLHSLQTTHNASNGCVFSYTTSIFGSFAFQYTSSIFHVLMVVYLLHLFINPLRQLVQIQQQNNNTRVIRQLEVVMTKYSIVHSLSIISAILLLIFCVLSASGYNYSVVDAFVNGIILILLNSIHNKVYRYLCCILHPCVMIYICGAETEKWKPRQREAEPTEDSADDRVGKGIGTQTKTVTIELTPVAHDVVSFESYHNAITGSTKMTKEQFNDKQEKTLQFLDAFSCDL